MGVLSLDRFDAAMPQFGKAGMHGLELFWSEVLSP